MESKEEKVKKTSTAKGVNIAKKTTSTKKAGTTNTKSTTKKESASKVASIKKVVPEKEAKGTTRKSTTKKSVPTKEVTAQNVTAEKAGVKSTRTTTKKDVPAKNITAKKALDSKKKNTSSKKAQDKKVPEAKEIKTTKKVETIPEEVVQNQETKSSNKKSKKQLENEKIENKQENKKSIDISIGAIICVIIIVGLLVLNIKLGKHAYKILNHEATTNTDIEPEKNISVTQEIGNVLNKTNDLVAQMKANITFPLNVTASIYNTEGFKSTTISNELKLILGWDKAEDSEKLKSINEKNEEVEAIEQKTMEAAIKDILGQNTQYIDESFSNNNISLFAGASKNKGAISYNDGLYTSILKPETEEGLQPLIYQEIQKVVKYSEKVIVYVKVAFIDVEEGTYKIYKNFNENKFSEKLLQLDSNELFAGNSFDRYTGEGTVTLEENKALDEIRIKLNTYKYIFDFDETTQKYYLSEFAKENA